RDLGPAGERARVAGLERPGHHPDIPGGGPSKLRLGRHRGEAGHLGVVAVQYPLDDRLAADVQLTRELRAARDLAARTAQREPPRRRRAVVVQPVAQLVQIEPPVPSDRAVGGEPTLVRPSPDGRDAHADDRRRLTRGERAATRFHPTEAWRALLP